MADEPVTKDSSPLVRARWITTQMGPREITDEWIHDAGAAIINGDGWTDLEALQLLNYIRFLEQLLDPEHEKKLQDG